MGTRDLTSRLVADLDPPARPVVVGYLREFAAALPASRRIRAAILAEIVDGLIEEITHTSGSDQAAIARAAIHTFGSPRHMAAQFARELTGKTAHCTGFALVSSGPLVGVFWLFALTDWLPSAHTLPALITGLFIALPVLPVLLLIIIPAALVAIAGAGRTSRFLPIATGTAGLAGLAAAGGCALLDIILMGHAALGGTWSPMLVAAVTISSGRLVVAGGAARRCARLRAAS